MLDTVLLQEALEDLVDEVDTSIAYDHPRYSKPWKDDLFENLGHNMRIISGAGDCFHPL